MSALPSRLLGAAYQQVVALPAESTNDILRHEIVRLHSQDVGLRWQQIPQTS